MYLYGYKKSTYMYVQIEQIILNPVCIIEGMSNKIQKLHRKQFE